MVVSVSRRNTTKTLHLRSIMTSFMAAAVLALSACAGDSGPEAMTEGGPAQAGQKTAGAGEPPALVFGGAAPGGARFSAPAATAKGTPDLNTVPTKAPTPPSTKEERAKAIEGLIADRTNARYSDQGGRTQPVAVRPLVDTPEAVRSDAVARLNAPAPERPAEDQLTALPLPSVVSSDVGPRSPGVAPRRSSIAGDQIAGAGGGTVAATAASQGGFRPLSEFQSVSYGKSTLAGTLSLAGGTLTASDRNVLNTTARQQIDSRGKTVLRVVGHGTGGLERAVLAARELQRLGVARDNLYVGADAITGPTEVFFEREK